jgi:hypothetical protein
MVVADVVAISKVSQPWDSMSATPVNLSSSHLEVQVINRICCCVLALSLSCAAVESGQVRYTGGTLDSDKAGIIGRLELTSESLSFEATAMRIMIPYRSIDSFEYSQEVKHHLGVLPAIAIGLVRKRKRSHFFRISFRDDHDTKQVVILEVSKQAVRTVQAVLAAKVQQPCVPKRPCNSQK